MNQKRLMKKLSRHKAVERLLKELWKREGTGYTPVAYEIVGTAGCEYHLTVNYPLSTGGSEAASGWMRRIGSFVTYNGYTVDVYRWVNRIKYCPIHKEYYDQMYWSWCEHCWDDMK